MSRDRPPVDGGEKPGWHADPARDLVLNDAQALRGLAHPIRLKLLRLLRFDGPSTASRLAARLGLSSAATSYHLRQLAMHGFIVPADPPETEHVHHNDRWWRSAHRRTYMQVEPATPEQAENVEGYLRAVAGMYADNVQAHLDEASTLPRAWADISEISDMLLYLTPRQTVQLRHELAELLQRYQADAAKRPARARGVIVQYQVFPRPGRP
ncbi:MAG: winged helix-turn-helix domain-containing protein [Mycobacteriales bacterium]